MHEGMLAYLCWRNREIPLYASQSEMPPEVSFVYRVCINLELAWKQGEDALREAESVARADTQRHFAELMPYAQVNWPEV